MVRKISWIAKYEATSVESRNCSLRVEIELRKRIVSYFDRKFFGSKPLSYDRSAFFRALIADERQGLSKLASRKPKEKWFSFVFQIFCNSVKYFSPRCAMIRVRAPSFPSTCRDNRFLRKLCLDSSRPIERLDRNHQLSSTK